LQPALVHFALSGQLLSMQPQGLRRIVGWKKSAVEQQAACHVGIL
jgi:hypothetical protein